MYEDLEPGPLMDALVAEEVMGWTGLHSRPTPTTEVWYGTSPGGVSNIRVPKFSRMGSAALQVFHKMPELPGIRGPKLYARSDGGVTFSWEDASEGQAKRKNYSIRADSIAEAVCRGALQAVGVIQPEAAA